MPSLSVDLAYKAYPDVGVAALTGTAAGVRCDLVRVPLLGQPAPDRLADFLATTCDERGITILLLDGPQGWKDEHNGLEHSRRCERELWTPAKTGTPGVVKPSGYRGFVEFSIAVFDALDRLGWSRLMSPSLPLGAARTAIESFPLSAWRSLGIPALPAKAKSTSDHLAAAIRRLREIMPLEISGAPTHDEVQAIVAGLAGVSLESGTTEGVAVSGVAPFICDGHWREGFIVNPTRRSVPPASA